MSDDPAAGSSSSGDVVAGGVTPGAADVPGWGGKLAFWLPWPLLVAADLISKHYVFGFLAETYPRLPAERRLHPVWDSGFVDFDLVSWGNTGTVWGLFQNGTVALMVLRCGALLGLLWFVRVTPRRSWLQLLVLSLVFAGAVGNLYDNFIRDDRSVRDFLFFTFHWPVEYPFPAFNVADSCITVGAIALFVLLWRDDRTPAKDAVS
ncbi:MAG: signal peptidase II [Planctomycetota bacterium]